MKQLIAVLFFLVILLGASAGISGGNPDPFVVMSKEQQILQLQSTFLRNIERAESTLSVKALRASARLILDTPE